MKINPYLVAALIGTHVAAAAVGYVVADGRVMVDAIYTDDRPYTRFDKVLDGDTVVVDGVAIHVRGLDAPELGPWAKCWAEAIAARQSMEMLESALRSDAYDLVDRAVDKDGKVSARFIKDGQYDITDPMKVYSAGATVDGKWDWCGTSIKLGDGSDGPPQAPNLWWPSGDVYDARAAD